MRLSHFLRSWITSTDGQVLGLALGYDHCAEHGSQAADLRAELGATSLDAVAEIEDHRITATPDHTHFEVYRAHCNTDRRKKYDAAFLFVSSSARNLALDRDRIREMTKPLDPGQPDEPAMRALMTAWGKGGFAVQVREPANIQTLKAFREELRLGGLLMVAPTPRARGGPVFRVERLLTASERTWLLSAMDAAREARDAIDAMSVGVSASSGVAP